MIPFLATQFAAPFSRSFFLSSRTSPPRNHPIISAQQASRIREPILAYVTNQQSQYHTDIQILYTIAEPDAFKRRSHSIAQTNVPESDRVAVNISIG